MPSTRLAVLISGSEILTNLSPSLRQAWGLYPNAATGMPRADISMLSAVQICG
jgi:hypothetical protein